MSKEEKFVEIKHTKVEDGKNRVQEVLKENQIEVPRTGTDVVEGRWRAINKGSRNLSGEYEKMVKATLDAINQSHTVTTQRNIYYTVRGAHPDWKFNGMELKEDKVYSAFVGPIMEQVQLATDRTMQSLGVRAAPRGYITGDGVIWSTSRGRIPLTAMPALSFDLVDEGVTVDSQARKIVHFEKDAGFEGLASKDNCTMIEAQFSTSQGYLVESANKYLADCQKRGLNVYVVHDADPHGLQMQLMYGMASKSNAYMPSSFYPLPRSCILLGLFPRVGKGLGLPAESVGEESRKIIPNLRKLSEEHPEMEPEIDIVDNDNQQWEFQALNGMGSEAPIIYLIESLRVKGDEIKFVPEEDSLKDGILNTIEKELDSFINNYMENYVDRWFQEGGLKKDLISKFKSMLAKEIIEWNTEAHSQLDNARLVTANDYREAVKLELVKDPKRYWDSAARSVITDMVEKRFKVESKPEVEVKMGEVKVDSKVEITEPEVPEESLTKDDITESIERRMVTRSEKRTPLVQKIRKVLEDIFGEPELEW